MVEEFYYIVAFATTKGIFRVPVAETQLLNPAGQNSRLYCNRDGRIYSRSEWARTWGEAKGKAEKRRDQAIKRLKKQLAALEAMTFTRSKETPG